MDQQSIERIIPLIYEAGFNDDAWSKVGDKLSTMFGDAGIGIDSLATISHIDAVAVSSRFDDAARDLHYEEYDTPDKNPGVAALFRAPIGKPFDFKSFVDAKTYDSDPSIRGILHPERIDKGLFVTLERNDRSFGFVSIFRRDDQPDFDAEHLRALEILARHIARSCKLRRTVIERDRQQSIAALKTSTGRAIEGSILLSLSGVIIEADACANAIIDSHIGLDARYGRLISTARTKGQDNDSLQCFLSSPANPNQSFTLWAKDTTLTTLERSPLPVDFVKSRTGRAVQMINLRCIRPKAAPNIAAFSSAYSLTNAETSAVVALTNSLNATKAATLIGISRETMKTHLTHIYAKTDLESLPQLMLLIGRFG